MITLDDFRKLDLRIGKVLSASLVDGSSKLLSILVDIGATSPRSIVSGVAKTYEPNELVGKTVIVIANLETKIFANVESQGMLIGIEQDNEGRSILIFIQDDIEPGSRLS